MLMRKILGWCDEKFEDVLDDETSSLAKVNATAFGRGAVEGLIDYMALFGTAAYITVIAIGIKQKLKK